MDHGGSVVDIAVVVNKADDGGVAVGRCSDLMEARDVGLDEVELQRQVLRRVTGHRHLRESHQIHAKSPGLVNVF